MELFPLIPFLIFLRRSPKMKISDAQYSDVKTLSAHLGNPLLFIGVSLAAIISAFVLASSSYDVETKAKAFSAIIVVFLIYCGIALIGRDEYSHRYPGHPGTSVSEADIERKLRSIEEAASYFGGSLKPADMFRLMASRVRDLVPFDVCVLFMIDRIGERMRIVRTDGPGTSGLCGLDAGLDHGIVGTSLASGNVEMARDAVPLIRSISDRMTDPFRSSAALPLKRDGEVFAVLELYSNSSDAFNSNSTEILEAICERVSPMILGSLSFEQILTSALTDPVTDLPNERAFFMIVENQLAESQRNREGRPLSLLAIDIKYFTDLNRRFGHAAGDKILNFVAQKIKDQLRQMDFFARSSNDEFLVILPTASEIVAAEIVARIDTEFASCEYSVNETQRVQIDLNFGVATFWKDGETAQMLLAVARERKEQSKSVIPSKVVWFPKEYVN